MSAQAFGDAHTKVKLETVQSYLRAYVTALKKQSFELLYIDACAGTGSSVPKGMEANGKHDLLGATDSIFDADAIIVGSALRALAVDPPFDRYLLNDVKKKNVKALQDEVSSKFPHLKDRVEISQFDANDMLLDLCKKTNWRSTRAVVFLDPFGLQIEYDTIAELARTKAVDLWYLVPVFAMYRQIRGDGMIVEDGGKRVDQALGTDSWREVVAVEEKVAMPLFDDFVSVPRKAVDVAWFEKVAMERLSEAFGGRVLDQTLPLGRNGLHEFSLMFAWANPSEPAKLAAKLAKAVLK